MTYKTNWPRAYKVSEILFYTFMTLVMLPLSVVAIVFAWQLCVGYLRSVLI